MKSVEPVLAESNGLTIEENILRISVCYLALGLKIKELDVSFDTYIKLIEEKESQVNYQGSGVLIAGVIGYILVKPSGIPA